MDIQRELEEDYQAGEDYRYELWYSEMKSMQNEGEIAQYDELDTAEPLDFN